MNTPSVNVQQDAAALLTFSDLVALTQVSRRHLEKLIRLGEFPRPCVYLGRLPRWRRSVVENWIAKGGN